jgi:hypothetical protein
MTDSAFSHFLFTPSLVKSTNKGPHSNDFETACLVDTSGLWYINNDLQSLCPVRAMINSPFQFLVADKSDFTNVWQSCILLNSRAYLLLFVLWRVRNIADPLKKTWVKIILIRCILPKWVLCHVKRLIVAIHLEPSQAKLIVLTNFMLSFPLMYSNILNWNPTWQENWCISNAKALFVFITTMVIQTHLKNNAYHKVNFIVGQSL